MSADTAAALRRLAELVEKDPSIKAMVEIETIGHMVKTSVVLWSVAPDAVEQPPPVQWCEQLVSHFRAPDRLCGAMLQADGTCPREPAHRKVAGW